MLSRLLTRNTPNLTHGLSYLKFTPSKYLLTNVSNISQRCAVNNPINQFIPSMTSVFFTRNPRKFLYPTHNIQMSQISISPFTSTIRIKSVKQEELVEPGIMEHDKYNACMGRPLSPHIRIYKKQLTSLLSFCHRLTGLMMVFYVYVVSVGSWLWPDITTFFNYLETLDIYVGEYWWTAGHRTIKFLVAYPFCYHALNAIRHLSWDFGKLLGMNQIYSSGYLMQAMVIVLAMALVFLVPFDLGGRSEEGDEVAGGGSGESGGSTETVGSGDDPGGKHEAAEGAQKVHNVHGEGVGSIVDDAPTKE